MKKKSIGLKAKLFLGKEVISTLNGLNLNHVVGGELALQTACSAIRNLYFPALILVIPFYVPKR